jgi:PAS domain S-box-containing protein
MLQQLKSLLTSPDTSTVYTAADLGVYLRVTLGIGIGLSACAGAGLYLLHDPSWGRFLFSAVLFMGVTLILLLLLRRGHVRLVTYGMVGAYSLVFVIGALIGTGVRGTAYSGLTLMVMVAGLFLGRRATVMTAGFSILFGLSLILINAGGGLINIDRPLSEIASWINYSVYFTLAALMLNFALRQIERALARARHELAERERAEAEVRRLNADLERRVAERTAQLAESEARYRLITDNASDVIWTTDLNLRLTYMSPAVERTRGFTPDEALAQSPEQTLTPESLQRALAAFAEEMSRVSTVPALYTRTLDLEYYRKDGSTHWSEVKVSFLRDATGQPLGLIGVGRAIDERRAAQLALRESEERLRLALDAAHMGSWDWNIATNTITWSDKVATIFGLPLRAFDGAYTTYLQLIHPEDRPALEQTLQAALTGQPQTYTLTHRVVWPDGSVHWLEGKGQVYRNEAGYPLRMTGVVADITERRLIELEKRRLSDELEEHVRQRTAALQAALAELETLSYTISHDLRAPVRAIDGFATILLDEHAPAFDAVTANYVDRIRTNAQFMGLLIDGLLNFIRLGRVTVQREWVEPQLIAQQVLNDLTAKEVGRTVEVVLGALPACQADPLLLADVYRGLIDNALKYSRKRDPARLELGWQPEAQAYFVRDNGVGFDMQYAHKLFGAFQRLHHPHEYDGAGMGLAIVQRILQRHGGQVWAEAEPDKGATFYFTL